MLKNLVLFTEWHFYFAIAIFQSILLQIFYYLQHDEICSLLSLGILWFSRKKTLIFPFDCS